MNLTPPQPIPASSYGPYQQHYPDSYYTASVAQQVIQQQQNYSRGYQQMMIEQELIRQESQLRAYDPHITQPMMAAIYDAARHTDGNLLKAYDMLTPYFQKYGLPHPLGNAAKEIGIVLV